MPGFSSILIATEAEPPLSVSQDDEEIFPPPAALADIAPKERSRQSEQMAATAFNNRLPRG